jgi:hypothetical protein
MYLDERKETKDEKGKYMEKYNTWHFFTTNNTWRKEVQSQTKTHT